MPLADSLVSACLLPLAIFILISGLDDLVLDIALVVRLCTRRHDGHPDKRSLEATPEKRIAVFVPLWREHRVIAGMLEHNIAAIRYRSYDFFIGAYPNDEPTVAAIREVETRFGNVHLAVCPHDGPTSKADCLNWIYQQMLLYEEQQRVRFEIVVTHDAEDLIHPESLRWINYYSGDYDMVQIPVLPLPTPWRQFTHGAYCDEFAEYQTKDVPVRQMLGSFLPSNGVGTGYSRRALEGLATTSSNRVFDPSCLTEDYENGIRLHELGFRQLFVTLRFQHGNPVATREYFPQSFRQAVRQRTRWIIGIALQAWERHGWGPGAASTYWFWRDRKGLVGNPASLLGNGIFLYGLSSWLWSRLSGTEWGLAGAIQHPALPALLLPTLCLLALRVSVRAACSARIYGWRFGLGSPLRTVWVNWLNSVATMLALWRYGRSRLLHQPLMWLKTDHLYPSRESLMPHKRKLGEILVTSGYLSDPDLEAALSSRPSDRRIGEHLVQLGKLTEPDLYEALSLQQSVLVEELDARRIRTQAARALPARVVRRLKVLPFKIENGAMFLAGPELPTAATERKLRRFTRLDLRFRLVTPERFEALRRELL